MEATPSTSESQIPHRPSLAEELTTIRQMLAALDTVTTAGQHHLMAKVLAFVEGQVDRVIQRPGPCNGHMLLEQLALLRHESDRQLPSASAFGERAESLLALLTISA
jgi:hypothetical protein